MDDLEQLIGILQGMVTTAGIVIGGVWAYFKFFRGRTFRLRLEPSISGVVIRYGRVHHLAVTASLKNVGLSKVDIEQRGSGLRLFSYNAVTNITEVRDVEWTRIKTFAVFEDHQWIEPGEVIEDQRLIAIPEDEHFAFLLELRIVSKGISWKERSIINVVEKARQSLSAEQTSVKEGGKE